MKARFIPLGDQSNRKGHTDKSIKNKSCLDVLGHIHIFIYIFISLLKKKKKQVVLLGSEFG